MPPRTAPTVSTLSQASTCNQTILVEASRTELDTTVDFFPAAEETFAVVAAARTLVNLPDNANGNHPARFASDSGTPPRR